MSCDKYDEETYVAWQVQFHDLYGEKSEESAWMTRKPDLEMVAAKAKEMGYEVFELYHRTEVVERYNVE